MMNTDFRQQQHEKTKHKRPPTVGIESDIYDQMRGIAAKNGMTLVDYVNRLLLYYLRKEMFLQMYAPSLHKIGTFNWSIFIKDDDSEGTSEVYMKDNKLYCTLCGKEDCIHVRYALLLPEVVEIKNKNSK